MLVGSGHAVHYRSPVPAIVVQNDKPGVEVNSIGMSMVRIEAGEFMMGNEGEIDYSKLLQDEPHARYLPRGGTNPHDKNSAMDENPLEWDEKPRHRVRISQPFYMSATPVTNAQFEEFMPEHRALRGKAGFSKADDDAVLFVSWHEAVAFTKWLSEKESVQYRLPTEAEWEYAARAGTQTPYFTGDTLPQEYWQHQVMNRTHSIQPERVNLAVAKSPANAWGLYNMHGLVEEWCADWYGPYHPGDQVDPTGALKGDVRVTRGGSHSTGLPFLRSANRSAAVPETKSYLIGFRVVRAEAPKPNPTKTTTIAKWAKDVKQKNLNWKKYQTPKDIPFFDKPKTYTRIKQGSNGPLYSIHNHEPALTVLPNGDLLAIWFTTVLERGREMVVAASRLRYGASEWDEADLFFKVADRNHTGQALYWDGKKTIYHISGVGIADDWKRLSIVIRSSNDNGVTWSAPREITKDYGSRQQVIDAVTKTSDGKLVLLCDAHWEGDGGSAVWVSEDDGKSWKDLGKDQQAQPFKLNNKGPNIAGVHANMVELKNGDWMAFGRGDNINGMMPMSISKNKGNSWEYYPSPFTPIVSAQRLAFTRLREGPLLMVTFQNELGDIVADNGTFKGIGMYAALSYDEGKTWPVKKLISTGDESMLLQAPCNLRWGAEFSLLDSTHAERRGYLTVDQAPDGKIHLLSSGTHYSFNLAWLESPNK